MTHHIYDHALIAAIAGLMDRATLTSDSWKSIAIAAHGVAAEVVKQYPQEEVQKSTLNKEGTKQ